MMSRHDCKCVWSTTQCGSKLYQKDAQFWPPFMLLPTLLHTSTFYGEVLRPEDFHSLKHSASAPNIPHLNIAKSYLLFLL